MELCDFSLATYISGEDVPILENWTVARSQKAFSKAVASIMREIVDGLIFVHGHDEVHRDLCPQNGDFHYLEDD
jgi:serine/threonine protein kinase